MTNPFRVCLVVFPATVLAQMKVFRITPPGFIRTGGGVGEAVTVTVTVGAGIALIAAADARAPTDRDLQLSQSMQYARP